MNMKDTEMSIIVDIVVDCCKSGAYEDTAMSRESLLGKSKKENACMARAILVCQLIEAGYTITTISRLLKRTVQGVRHIIKSNYALLKSSRAYKVASGEVAERCKMLLSSNWQETLKPL